MANRAIEQQASGLTVGHAQLGERSGKTGSIAQMVHDGDTVTVRAAGNFGLRLLGVDAAETSFRLPGQTAFRSLNHPDWEAFLFNPFNPNLEPIPDLSAGLRTHLEARTGPGAATNQYRHAVAAQRAFEQEMKSDLEALGVSEEDFGLFIAFSFEVMDRYGRFLGFVNREQPSSTRPTPRPLTYNERLLRLGLVVPYFIWPNIDPFRSRGSRLAAVIPPGKARLEADRSTKLRNALAWVHEARLDGTGVFDPTDPLCLLPFELRLLAGRRVPDRWVIDLDSDSDVLIHPQRYFEIEKPENRLFIPPEYKALFVEAGWKPQTL
jgi:hypothetical protein